MVENGCFPLCFAFAGWEFPAKEGTVRLVTDCPSQCSGRAALKPIRPGDKITGTSSAADYAQPVSFWTQRSLFVCLRCRPEVTQLAPALIKKSFLFPSNCHKCATKFLYLFLFFFLSQQRCQNAPNCSKFSQCCGFFPKEITSSSPRKPNGNADGRNQLA